MQPLAKKAIATLKKDKISFYPSTKRDELIAYLEGLRDWNISRQIAWGIPIPAFQNVDDEDDWIYDERVSEEILTIGGKTYRRDPDVFDTWWSSSQWPYATLNWPDSDDAKQFYPTSLMETGTDLLRQWVSRMINMGLYVTGEVPFKEVYFHGMVTDEHGAKMSKSKGNVLNPIDLMDQYGSDAVRIGLMTGTTAGNNQPFTVAKVVGGRNFCNKLWNIARYIESILGEDYVPSDNIVPQSLADHWVLQQLAAAQDSIDASLASYRIGEAFDTVYHTVWDDVADWYIEANKLGANKDMMAYALDTVLKLTHPFAPFVTETIWQTLGWTGDELLCNQSKASPLDFDRKKAAAFVDIQNIVTEIRYITTALDVRQPSLYFTNEPFLAEAAPLLKKLAKLANVAEVESGRGMHLTQTKLNCWLDIDLNTAKHYVEKLRVDHKAKQASIDHLQARLDNKGYTAKAPKAVVQATRDQLAEEKTLLAKLESELERFETHQK